MKDEGLLQKPTQTCAEPLTSAKMQEVYDFMMERVRDFPPIPILSLPLKFFPDINLTISETKQIKFPKSKRKRIVKKWAKNKKNFRTLMVPSRIVYRRKNGDLYAHPEMIKEIEWGLKNDPAYFINIRDIPEYDISELPKFELPPFKPIFSYGFQPFLKHPIILRNITS